MPSTPEPDAGAAPSVFPEAKSKISAADAQRIKDTLLAMAAEHDRPTMLARELIGCFLTIDAATAVAMDVAHPGCSSRLTIEPGSSTLENEAAEQGLDWEEVLKQRRIEHDAFRAACVLVPAWGDSARPRTPLARRVRAAFAAAREFTARNLAFHAVRWYRPDLFRWPAEPREVGFLQLWSDAAHRDWLERWRAGDPDLAQPLGQLLLYAGRNRPGSES